MANIRDVAKLSGVTIGTVSRAFNGYDDINELTKQKIFEAARELHYTPHAIARSLSSKVSPRIGMIVSGFLNTNDKDNILYLLEKGIYQYTLENDLEVAIFTTEFSKLQNKSYAQFCREHSISGAILSGITTDDVYLHELLNSEIPCVAVDVPLEGRLTGCVTVDDRKAEADMTEYLITNRHRDFAVIAGKKNASVTSDRIDGVLDVCRKNGISLEDGRIFYCDFDERMAKEKVLSLLRDPNHCHVTAFICQSDIMAIGALHAIREAGYTAPGDFSVAGFDDIPLAVYVEPTLTTVAQDFTQKGYESAKLLRRIILGEPCERNIILPYEMRIRSSVRPLTD